MIALGGLLRALGRPRWRRHAIPSMDGPWHPNSDLEALVVLSSALSQPDDALAAPDGSLWVSEGSRLLRVSVAGDHGVEVVRTLPGDAGALAEAPSGGVAVCVAGKGVLVIGGDLDGLEIAEVAGTKLVCATSVTFAPGGTMFIAEGSCEREPAEWIHDLMSRGASGRIWEVDPRSGVGELLCEGLEWPGGLVVSHGGRELLFVESWAHTVSSVPLDERGRVARPAAEARRVVVPNLPGYPARLARSADGGYWMCLLALRTQLVELTLEDEDYRVEMMRTIEPWYWIAPQLVTAEDFLEPLQGGGIKQLGIKKPWAPPRSYGLIAKLDAELECVSTMHSRNGGTRHGITGVCEHGGRLYAVSKGHGLLLSTEMSSAGGVVR